MCVPWNGGPRAVHSSRSEQAKILVAEAEENNLGEKALNEIGGIGGACSFGAKLPCCGVCPGQALEESDLGPPDSKGLSRGAMTV